MSKFDSLERAAEREKKKQKTSSGAKKNPETKGSNYSSTTSENIRGRRIGNEGTWEARQKKQQENVQGRRLGNQGKIMDRDARVRKRYEMQNFYTREDALKAEIGKTDKRIAEKRRSKELQLEIAALSDPDFERLASQGEALANLWYRGNYYDPSVEKALLSDVMQRGTDEQKRIYYYYVAQAHNNAKNQKAVKAAVEGSLNTQPYLDMSTIHRYLSSIEEGISPKISQDINTKKQLENQLDWVQKGNRLASVGDPKSENYDKDFKEKSKYVPESDLIQFGNTKARHKYINANDTERINLDDSGQFAMYGKMTAQEIALYNYYYNTGGKDAAEEYLHTIEEDLSWRQAADQHEWWKDKPTWVKELYMVPAGINQFATGMEDLIAGNDEYNPANTTQQLSGMIRSDMGPVAGTIYDLGTTIFNMIPSIAASAAAGMINPALGTVVGTGLMGASAAGNAYAEKINAGWDDGQAKTYAAITGVSEAVLQYALGGIGKLGGVSGKLATAVKGIDKAAARFALQFGGKMLSEGFEEGLQEVLTPFIENMALGYEKNNWSDVEWEQAAYSALLGALSAGVLESVPTARSTFGENSKAKKIAPTIRGNNGVQAVLDIASSADADSNTRGLYDIYTKRGVKAENISDLQLGRLYQNAKADGLDLSNVGKQLKQQDMKQIVEEYTEAVDDKILDFAELIRKNKSDNSSKLVLGDVGSRAVSDIRKLTGIDVSGYKHSMKANTIRHIDKNHGENGGTDTSMSDDRDLARIQYVLDNYDSVELLPDLSAEYRTKEQKKAPMIKFKKRVNGSYYVVEAVPDTKRQELPIVSVYKNKAVEQQTVDVQAPTSNVQNASPGTTLSNPNIPQSNGGVNGGSGMSATLYAEKLTRNGESLTAEEARAASGYGAYGAEVLANAVNNAEGQTFSQVKGDMHLAYLNGRVNKGMRFETDLQREAYYAGKKDAELGRLIAKKKAGYATVYGEESGLIPNDASKNVSPKMQKALNIVAKDLGVKVMFVDNIFVNKKGDQANAAMGDDGIFRISASSTQPLYELIIHEPFHRMRQFATQEYFDAMNFAVQHAEQLGLRLEQGNGAGTYYEALNNLFTEKGISHDDAKILDELAAQFYQKIVSNDADALRFIQEMNKTEKSRSALQKFMDYVKELIGKLQKAVRKLRNQGEYAAARQMDMTIKELETARKFYLNAYRATKQAVEYRRVEQTWDVREDSAAEKNTNMEVGVSYSLREIVDEDGKSYGIGVVLDSVLLENLTPEQRVEMVKDYVKKIGGKIFTAYEDNGNAVNIRIAKSTEYFKNHKGKNIPVNRDLTSYLKNETKQESITLIDELIVSAKKTSEEPSRYSHGWLDNKGKNNWDYWTTYIQDKDNAIWEAVLNIANSAHGEKILYDIFPIKKVGQSVTSDKSTTNNSISQTSGNSQQKVFDNEGADYALKDEVEVFPGKSKADSKNYTEQEYRDYGWARENGILTADQNADYRSKFAKVKSGQIKFPRSKKGEYIIPVSDIYDSDKEGINNVLVFARGTIDKPIITSIIEIYEYDETSLDIVRRHIYDRERRGFQPKTGELFERYFASDFRVRGQQGVFSQSDGDSSDNGYGRRSGRETSEVERGVGEQDHSLKDEVEVSYSLKGEWHTDLTKAQLKMVDDYLRGAGSPESTRITDTANWYMGRLDGDDLFVIYSHEDVSGPTILYEVKGKQAKLEKNILMDILEDEENGKSVDGKPSFTERLSKGDWVQNEHSMADSGYGMLGAKSGHRNATVLQGKSSSHGSRAFRNVVKNLLEIQEERIFAVDHSLKDEVEVFPGKSKAESKNYTEQEYQDYGWARENGILTADQNADYRSKFAMAKSGQMKFPRSKKGEYIIPVSDIYDFDKEGINNVLVFAKGTIDKPVITSIIEIYEYDETSLDEKRRYIYACERRGIQPEIGNVFERYNAIDFQDKRQRSVHESDGDRGDNRYGGRSGRETTEVERGVGEQERVGEVSYSLKGEWHTDLTKNQVIALEKELDRVGSPTSTKITDTANWYMTRVNGNDVFVIYSVEDSAGSTILYETKINARQEKNLLMGILEVVEDGESDIGRTRDINRLLGGDWMQEKRDMADSNAGSRKRGSDTGDATVLQREPPQFVGSRAFRNVVKNLFEIQEKRISTVDHSLKDEVEVSPKRTKELLDTIAYLKGQFETTKFAKADPKKLKTMTRKLLKEYSSKLDLGEMTTAMDELYRYMANGEDGHPAAWDETFRRAKEIATRIAEGALETDNSNWVAYEDLRKYLRSTTLYIHPSEITDARDFNRRNMGRMRITTTDRTAMGVDEMFQELSYIYPEYFNEDKAGSGSDLLYQMEAVLDSLRPVEFNPFSGDMSSAITSIANDMIQNFFEVPQAKPTFADRAEQRVAKARIDGAKKVEAQRESAKRALERAKASKEKALERERKKADARVEKMSETRKAQVLRAKITRVVGRLSKKLLKPSDKNHIPPELQKAVNALLYNINLESAYSYDPETKSYKRNESGLPTKRTDAFRDLKDEYAKIAEKNNYGLVLAPELLGDRDYGIGSYFDEVMKLSDKKIADMTSEELSKVYDVVRLVEHSVVTAGKMFTLRKWETLKDVGRAFEASTATRRAKHAMMERHFALDLETPLTFFSHFGNAGKELFRALRTAQDNEQLMQNELAEVVGKFVSSEFVKSANKETFEFKTTGGETLTLSKAHIMNLYLLSKREQAKKHLVGGGIHQPDIGKIRRSSESTRLTEIDLGNMFAKLTEEDKKVCENLQKATRLLAKWGNEASMRVFGYEKFKDPNYWTIKVAPESVHQSVEKNNDRPRSIKNMGSAKAVVPEANNSLDIDDVFTVFARHSSDMLCYSAWLEVMEDAGRLYNYEFVDEEGLPTGRSFQSMLNKYAGEGGSRYFFQLMKDIQNGLNMPADTATEKIVAKLYGNAQRAAVAGNLRVVIQQPTAYVRAASVLNIESLLGALTEGIVVKPTLDGWKKAVHYAPIATRKAVGGYEIGANAQGLTEVLYTPDTFKGKAKKAVEESGFWGAGKADELTWGVIWNACEIETNKNKKLEKGSEEYYRAVADLFTQVIDETQVVDGVLQRSQVMRTSAGLVKQMTAFTGEPTQGANIVIRAYDQLRYETDPVKRGKAIKKFGRAVFAYLLTGITTALAMSLADALRDDDEEDYWKKFWKHFSGIQGDEKTWFDYVKNVVLRGNLSNSMNPLTWIPIAKDLLSMMQGYDVERMDAAVMGDLLDATNEFVMTLNGEGKKTVGYAGWNLLLRGAKVFGKSPYNVIRDAEGIIRTFQVETDNLKARYDFEKLRTKPSTNLDAYIDILYKAYETDNEAYDYIYNDLIKSGVETEKIKSKMESRMKKTEGVEKTEDLSKRYMSPDDEKKYDNSLRKVKTSDAWRSANASQRKEAEAHLHDFLTSSSESMEKTRAEARSAGVDETEYVLWQLAKEVVLGEDDSWNAVKKASAIELIDLGDSELAYFYDTETADKAYFGGVSVENFAKFKAAVSGLKGDGKKAKVLAAADRYADNPKEWIFFMGSEYPSYKKRSDYILYFGE